jgi:response regulator NasT
VPGIAGGNLNGRGSQMERITSRSVPMESLKVVVADDDAVMRTLLRARLEKLGHELVGEADNGATAVELVKAHRPDVVILDIRMPEVDGIEAARQITAETPCAILFLTAFGDQVLVEQATEAGAFGYLMKPFRKEDLAPAMEVAMRRFRELQNRSEQIAELKEALETRKVVERAKGILMQRHNLTEDEAFKRIHFQARNQNKKMREIAESIITAADLI